MTKRLSISLFQFSHSVISNSWRPHGLQHARPPYPSPTPGACSNSCLVIPFSSCLPSFPASGSFQWVSSSHHVTKVLELQHQSLNIQGRFPLGLGLVSLQFKGLSRVFFSTIIQKHQFFSAQPCLWSNSHICTWLLEIPDHLTCLLRNLYAGQDATVRTGHGTTD